MKQQEKKGVVMDDRNYENKMDQSGQSIENLGYPGALALDPEKYRKYVDDFDISEEQKIKLLHTLWDIMTAFVQLGWGVDNIQHFIPALKEFSSQPESDEVKTNIRASTFNEAAAKDEVQKKEGS